jgi:hypothetical protein
MASQVQNNQSTFTFGLFLPGISLCVIPHANTKLIRLFIFKFCIRWLPKCEHQFTTALHSTSCSESPLIFSLHPGTTSPHFKTFTIDLLSRKVAGHGILSIIFADRVRYGAPREPSLDVVAARAKRVTIKSANQNQKSTPPYGRVYTCQYSGRRRRPFRQTGQQNSNAINQNHHADEEPNRDEMMLLHVITRK